MYPIKSEETKLVKEYILLPLVLSVFERDLKIIQASSIKLKEPYIESLEHSLTLTTKELAKIKAALRQRGIRVYEELRNDKEIGCKFLCRGYHEHFSMQWEYVRAEVIVRMRRFLGGDGL